MQPVNLNNEWTCYENENVGPDQPTQMNTYQSNTYKYRLGTFPRWAKGWREVAVLLVFIFHGSRNWCEAYRATLVFYAIFQNHIAEQSTSLNIQQIMKNI